MPVPQGEQRILFARSGGRCAFPSCPRSLIAEGIAPDRPVVLGEVAHIVAESPDGPRGSSTLSLAERNRHDNLVLLCNVHHELVDGQTKTYTVERLHAIKQEHEAWVEKTLGRSDDWTSYAAPPTSVSETLHSTLLWVERMPLYVYGVPCALASDRDVAAKLRPLHGDEMAPFILRDGKLLTFQNLNYRGGPFADLASGQQAQRWRSSEWWQDPDLMRWFVELTNRALNKLTGRRYLNLDKKHHRYFFQSENPGQEMKIVYRPLNDRTSQLNAVWQPKSRRTGEPRGYWYHRAVGLRFLYVGNGEWCLSIRPGLHITVDGVRLPPPDTVGARVTRKKSRMFNYDLLREVNFWREHLSDSTPRIIMKFGEKQHIVVPTTLMQGTVSWPGIPEEYAKPFRNVEHQDDLFSLADFNQLGDSDEDDEELEDEDVYDSEGLDDD